MGMSLNLYEIDPQIYDDYISTEIEITNFNKVFELIEKTIGKTEKTKILDFCCGTGFFPRNWLTKLNNIEYIGVDINKNFTNFAKSRLDDKRFSFVNNDAVSFKSDEKFDIVLATSSYHHIKDSQKRDFLKNIVFHLKNSGHLIVYEKIVESFSNEIEAVDSGTKFYLERIKYMMKTEKLSENQVFALFNEQYLTSIRKDEYKVDFQHFQDDINSCGMKIKDYIKLWPQEDIFKNDKVGDFVFLITK